LCWDNFGDLAFSLSNIMSRIRYSAEVRQHAIARVLESHTPATHVARDIGCSLQSLRDWLKQYRQQNTPPTEPASFVPVNVVAHQNHSIEIILPNGITLRLSETTPHYLAELLSALAPC
jgi:transposase-like protein